MTRRSNNIHSGVYQTVNVIGNMSSMYAYTWGDRLLGQLPVRRSYRLGQSADGVVGRRRAGH